MQNKLQSFAVGTSMVNNKLSAVALKLKLENGESLLTRWDRPMAERLLKALGEYMLYLHTKKIDTSSEAVNEAIRINIPTLDQKEIDNASPSALVAALKGRVEADQMLKLFIQIGQEAEPKEIIIAPVYVMPLNDYVGGILDRFDTSGNLLSPSDTVH